MTTNVKQTWRNFQEVRFGESNSQLLWSPTFLGINRELDSEVVFSAYVYAPGAVPSSFGSDYISNANLTLKTYQTGADNGAVVYAMAIDASDQSVFPLGENYRVEFVFSFEAAQGGVVSDSVYETFNKVQTIYFDVVRQPLYEFCPVSVEDLAGVHSEFDAALLAQDQAHDAATRYIIPAWLDVLDWVRSKGRRPSLVSGPEVFRQLAKYGALKNLCLGLMRSPTDIRARLYEEFSKRYEEAKNTIVLNYREDDGVAPALESGWVQPALSHTPNLRDIPQRKLAWRNVT